MTTDTGGMTISTSANFNPQLMDGAHKRISNHCNRVVMAYHWEHHLPDHFKEGAGRKYGYKARRSSISLKFLYRTNRSAYDRIRKLTGKNGKPTARGFYKDVKAALGLDPLEWSGQTRRMIENPINRTITATATRGRLRVRTPNYVASRLKSGKQGRARQMQAQALERAAELEVMTAGEIRKLQKVFGDEYVAVQKVSHPKHAALKITFRQRARRRKG
jgi:hypothetical protein